MKFIYTIIYFLYVLFNKKLPDFYKIDDVRTMHPNKHEESLNSVLHQECMRYNNLLKIVKDSLKNIKDAINGNAVMTNEIEEMFKFQNLKNYL